MKYLMTLLLVCSFTISAQAMDKQEGNNQPNSTNFNSTKDLKDNGCFNLIAGIPNKNSRYIKEFYHTILLDIWFNNPKMKKFPRPTKDSVDRTLLKLCNYSMSNNYSFNFVIYQKSLELKMSHEKYFSIDDRVYKKNFK